MTYYSYSVLYYSIHVLIIVYIYPKIVDAYEQADQRIPFAKAYLINHFLRYPCVIKQVMRSLFIF